MPPRKEQQSHLPTLPLSPGPHGTNSMLQLRHQKKPPLPSLDFPGPKADFFPPEVCLHFLQKCPQPFPRPQQLQLLSQAWLGMEMCSWYRNSTPEPAFGYQPWVWFEILPQENVRPLAEPFSLRPWRKSPATNSTTSLSSSFSAHLPEAQAAAPWHLSKPAWPQIHHSQC